MIDVLHMISHTRRSGVSHVAMKSWGEPGITHHTLTYSLSLSLSLTHTHSHQFHSQKTPSDCRLHWENHVSPKVYHGPWSKEEEKKLMKLANQYNCTDWMTIAREIGVGVVLNSWFLLAEEERGGRGDGSLCTCTTGCQNNGIQGHFLGILCTWISRLHPSLANIHAWH